MTGYDFYIVLVTEQAERSGAASVIERLKIETAMITSTALSDALRLRL